MRRVLDLGAVAFLMMALATVPVAAQQQEGDSELQLQGTLSISTGDAEDSGAVSVNWGRFFTDRQEIGATAFTFFTADGDVAGYAGPFYRYNLASGTTVPYVGASAAAGFGDFSSGDALVNLEGGVRWFLARNMAFTLGGVYTYDVDESEFLDAVQVLFGFSYLWDRN